jgi:hypothetical protein
MNSRILRNSNFIKVLYFAEPLQRKEMIESISQDEICAVSDIVKNTLEGRLVVNYVSIGFRNRSDSVLCVCFFLKEIHVRKNRRGNQQLTVQRH